MFVLFLHVVANYERKTQMKVLKVCGKLAMLSSLGNIRTHKSWHGFTVLGI